MLIGSWTLRNIRRVLIINRNHIHEGKMLIPNILVSNLIFVLTFFIESYNPAMLQGSQTQYLRNYTNLQNES